MNTKIDKKLVVEYNFVVIQIYIHVIICEYLKLSVIIIV